VTTNNKTFLLSFISIIYAFILYLILESDIVIYGQDPNSKEVIEAVSGTMNFQEME
jgi:hypothetical protein